MNWMCSVMVFFAVGGFLYGWLFPNESGAALTVAMLSLVIAGVLDQMRVYYERHEYESFKRMRRVLDLVERQGEEMKHQKEEIREMRQLAEEARNYAKTIYRSIDRV